MRDSHASRTFFCVALLLPVVLALAACGGSNGTTSVATSPAGSSPAPSRAPAATQVATCPAGATPDRPGPAGQPRPDLDQGIARITMDGRSGQVIAVDGEPPTIWAFDVCTNSWRRMRPAGEPSLEGVSRLVYDADADLIIAFDAYSPLTYSVGTNSWTHLPDSSPTPPSLGAATDLAYDPTTGDVLLRDGQARELWSYAVEANTWTRLEQGAEVPPGDDEELAHSLLAYDDAADRLVLALLAGVPGAATWTFDPGAATWNKQTARPPSVNTGYFESGGEIVFDAARGVSVIFTDGVLATYDAGADRWKNVAPGSGWPALRPVDNLPTGPLARLGHWLVYDPVNERIVLFGGRARMRTGSGAVVWRDLDDVWAYDLAANVWLRLLPPAPR